MYISRLRDKGVWLSAENTYLVLEIYANVPCFHALENFLKKTKKKCVSTHASNFAMIN